MIDTKRLLAEATPGPWKWAGEDYCAGWGWQLLVGPQGEGLIVGQGSDGGPEPRLRAHVPVDPALCITGMMAHGKERVNAVHVFGKGNADLIRSAPELAARVVELERQRKTICEALYNMIYLARPHFTDDVQRLAIAEASAALDFAAYTP